MCKTAPPPTYFWMESSRSHLLDQFKLLKRREQQRPHKGMRWRRASTGLSCCPHTPWCLFCRGFQSRNGQKAVFSQTQSPNSTVQSRQTAPSMQCSGLHGTRYSIAFWENVFCTEDDCKVLSCGKLCVVLGLRTSCLCGPQAEFAWPSLNKHHIALLPGLVPWLVKNSVAMSLQ